MACYGRGPRRKPFLSNKNMATRLWFARLYLNKPRDFWNKVLWTDETKLEMFGHNAQHHFRRKPNSISTQTPNSSYQAQWWMGDDFWLVLQQQDPDTLQSLSPPWTPSIRGWNERPSLWQLKLGWNWAMQQDNYPKYKGRSTTEWLKNKESRYCNIAITT